MDDELEKKEKEVKIFNAEGDSLEDESDEDEQAPIDKKLFETNNFNIDDEEEHVVRFDPKKGETADPVYARASNVARNCIIPAKTPKRKQKIRMNLVRKEVTRVVYDDQAKESFAGREKVPDSTEDYFKNLRSGKLIVRRDSTKSIEQMEILVKKSSFIQTAKADSPAKSPGGSPETERRSIRRKLNNAMEPFEEE